MAMKESKGRIAFNIINYLLLTLMSICFVMPYIFIFSASFTDEISFIKKGFSLFPTQFSFEAYKFLLLTDNLMIGAIFNSLKITVLGTALTTITCILFAYPLSKKYLKGNKFFSIFMIFTMLFSGGLIPGYLVVSYFFDDSHWALIVPGMMAAYYTILIKNYFCSLPDSFEEAAKMDGANDFRVLFTIFIPLSKPVIATVVLFAAVSKWNDWVGPMLFLSSRNKYPIQYLIQNLITDVNSIYSVGGDKILPSQTLKYASVILGSLPIIILYPFLQRYFINGMIIGGVKE